MFVTRVLNRDSIHICIDVISCDPLQNVESYVL